MEACDQSYILQEYCKPYESLNLDFNLSESPEFDSYNNITGMFVYNGKLAGLYSRAGQTGVISSHNRGMTIGSLVVG